MIVFGVELKGSEARVVIAEKDTNGLCIGKDYKKIKINSPSQDDATSFRDLFVALIDQYSPSKLVLNVRQQKGEFAAGAMTFLMEGILLTLNQVEVVSFSVQTLSAKLKLGAIQPAFPSYPQYTEKAYQLASVGCL